MTPRGPLALQHQLAGLATLEASVRTALRALHVAYPVIGRPSQDDDGFEVMTARALAERCDDLLAALDDHRSTVAPRLHTLQRPDQTSWPF